MNTTVRQLVRCGEVVPCGGGAHVRRVVDAGVYQHAVHPLPVEHDLRRRHALGQGYQLDRLLLQQRRRADGRAVLVEVGHPERRVSVDRNLRWRRFCLAATRARKAKAKICRHVVLGAESHELRLCPKQMRVVGNLVHRGQRQPRVDNLLDVRRVLCSRFL